MMDSGDSAVPVNEPGWWRRRSLKLRIAAWFTVIAGGIMLGLLPVVYTLIERRLHIEMDRQLGIDWALVEAHLEPNDSGGVRWRTGSPATPKSAGYAETWFDVWSGGDVLMSHWPKHGAQVQHPPKPAENPAAAFYNIVLDHGFPARTLQKSVGIGGRDVTLRVFRDESGIRATLRQILIGLALGMPVAVLLAALGGYLMAGRTLKPISEMADHARQITSESLGRRLPNPNPHDEPGQLATVFNETLQRLENSFESLKRFTADASHELRTPLTALRSVGEVALREAGDAEALRETIGSMLEEAQRLNDLTDTLLMLARVESGRLPLHREPVSLSELVAEVCDSLEVLAAEKRQRIEVTSEPGLTVHADRVLLRQAVMNLLHNGICYSPPDSALRVNCTARGSEAVIEVADQGPGIAPEHQSKVFERFYRIDKARSRAEGGAGLGLALAKLFIEQNGGSIGLSSEFGQGSCFWIQIPQFVAEVS
jgi:heavy metal sensor kinase